MSKAINRYIEKFKRERKAFMVFSFLSLLPPMLAIAGICKPVMDTPAEWFQRSGSAMVIFAVFAELFAFRMFDVFKPSGMVENNYKEAAKQYKWQVKYFNAAAICLTIVATLIWGYGDIPFNYS